MTTEEKLQNFYNHSLDSANREAERVIGDHQKALDKIFEEHKATARRQAEEEVAAETEKAKRDVNKTLSADQLHIRRKLSRKNLELKEKLFKEVREKLTAYKKDPSYDKPKKEVSAFANFTQRKYDYDKLEKQLLGWADDEEEY